MNVALAQTQAVSTMQKLLLLPILGLLSYWSNGQTPNFFIEGARWVYQTSESFEPGQQSTSDALEQNIIHGDTLLGGVFYHKIYSIINGSTTSYPPYPQPPITNFSYWQSGPTFVRFDSVENKVYYRPSADSTERIIYDFNLQVGDFLPMQPTLFTPGRVDSIENVSLFGIPVKKFYTTGSTGGAVYEENYILEGMGGSNGLAYFQPMALLVSGGIFTTRLLCFQSGDSIYSRNSEECPFLELVSTGSPENKAFSVLVSPNPTQGHFDIRVREALHNATFVVLDCLGRKVVSQVLMEQTASGQLPRSGIYFWYLEKDGRRISSGRLICN